MKGYWRRPEESARVLRRGADGRIWFHTGDVARIDEDGYTTIVQRKKDLIIVDGFNVYPSEVEGALLGVADLVPQYLLVVDRTAALARVEIQVEPAAAFLERCASVAPDHPAVGKLRSEVAARLKAALGLSVEVTLVSPRTIPRSEGKAVRVVERT